LRGYTALATTALLSAQLHRAGTRYLDHFATNESVSDAKVRVTIGDAEPVDAEPTENGIYTIPFPHLARTGSVEVVFNVTATSGDDLLVGGLTLRSDTEPSDRGASSIGAVSSIWISSIPWGIQHPIVLILITFGLGVLFGHLHRSGRFAAAMATGAVAAGILVILAVVALGGNDHDRSSNAVRTTMAAGMSDAPRRLPDGTAFVAKPTQRLLEVRTAAAERETVRPAVNLIGPVHT
jgi:cobalt-zinc-cadmium efflux system membrane fusion protein